jgi:hypothetical protein
VKKKSVENLKQTDEVKLIRRLSGQTILTGVFEGENLVSGVITDSFLSFSNTKK